MYRKRFLPSDQQLNPWAYDQQEQAAVRAEIAAEAAWGAWSWSEVQLADRDAWRRCVDEERVLSEDWWKWSSE